MTNGDTVTLNGSTVGKVENIQFGGNVDAAFVDCTWGDSSTKDFMNGDSYVAVDVI